MTGARTHIFSTLLVYIGVGYNDIQYLVKKKRRRVESMTSDDFGFELLPSAAVILKV